MEHHQTQPLHVRIGHWINAVTLLVMLRTGFSMFAGDRDFASIVTAVPALVWTALFLRGTHVSQYAWHLAFGIVLVCNAAWYAFAAVRTASGVPSYLQWTLQHRANGGHGRLRT